MRSKSSLHLAVLAVLALLIGLFRASNDSAKVAGSTAETGDLLLASHPEICSCPAHTMVASNRSTSSWSESARLHGLPDGLPERFSVKVPIGERELTLALEKHSIYGENTRFLVQDATGAISEMPVGPDRSYLGAVEEHPAYDVTALLTESGLMANINRPGEDPLVVKPEPGSSDSHEISIGDQQEFGMPSTEDDASDSISSTSPIAAIVPGAPGSPSFRVMSSGGGGSTATLPPGRVMDVLEYEIGVEIGSRAFLESYGSNLSSAQNAAASVITNLDARYLSACGIKHRLGTVMIRTDAGTDPMRNSVTSNSSGSLSAFRDYWNANPGEVGTTHDLAVYHVKYPPSGRAYVNSVGSSNRYAVSCGNGTSSWANGTLVHEFGHSWNLRHVGDAPINEYNYNGGGTPPGSFYEAKPRNGGGSSSAGGNHDFISPMHGSGTHNIGRWSTDEANTVYGIRQNKRGFGDLVASPPAIKPFGQRDMTSAFGTIPVTIDVVANDFDANNDVLDARLLDTVSHRGGTISLSPGTGPGGRNELVYTPPANSSGSIDFFHYTVCDTTNRTDFGTVYVSLLPDPTPKEVDPASYIADSIQDWVSDTQGANGWQYGMGSSASFSRLSTRATESADVGGDRRTWKNGSFSPVVGQYAMYPGGGTNAAIKRWTSDYDGPVVIHLSSERLADPSSGNGQTLVVAHNGVPILSRTLNSGTTKDVWTVEALLESGDTVDLLVNSNGDNTFDWTAAHLRIVRADYYRDDPTLILHYPFDESFFHPGVQRETAADHSGNNCHADLVDGEGDVAWAAGHLENAFRTENDGVHLQSPVNVGDGSDELTLSIWFKPESKDDNDGVITSTGPDFNGIILSGYGEGNPVEFRARGNGLVGPDNTAPVGKWTHAVGTWKSGQFQRLYLNGELVAEDNTPPSGSLNVDYWRIGKDRDDNNRNFHGLVDDVALWSRALDSGEIRALFHQGLDAFDIDGSDDVVQLPYSPVANGGSELTLSTWIRPRSKANNDGLISATGSSYHALLFKGADGLPLESRSMSNSLFAGTTAPNDEWTHVTSVWKSGQIQRLYIDGVQAANDTTPPGGVLNVTAWYFGRDRVDNNRIIDGLLGEPTIIGRALSAADVAELASVGRANFNASHGFFARAGHIGSSSGESHFSEGGGVFTLSGGGTGIGGTADDFEFAARQYAGDYQLDVRLEDFHGASANAEAGIMIRDSLAPGSKFVCLRVSPNNTLALERRHTTNAATVIDASQPGTAPSGTFLRLARVGRNFTASYSTNGTAFTTLASVGVDMVNNAHAGVILASANATVPGAAQFSRVGISPPNPDSDGDGLKDSWEVMFFGDLATSDGLGGQDFDRDSLDDVDEHTLDSDPTLVDSDGDGLNDGDEVNLHGSDPTKRDSDDDGFPDGIEVAWGTSPSDRDDIPAIPGLVAYYPLDEGSGDTARDLVGGFDGVENQNTIGWTTDGISGGALDLPGNASLLAPDAFPAGTTALTISAWVNPDAIGGYKGIFAGRDNPGNWGLNVEGSHVDYRFANSGGTSFGLDSSDDSISATSGWHHLAITWKTDGVTSTSTAYLDGVAIGPSSSSANLSYLAPSLGYFIGDDPCCGGREFNGQIDDIALFSSALKPDEIARIYSEGQEGRSVLYAFTPAREFRVIRTAVDSTTGDVTITWNSSSRASSFSVLSSTDLSQPIDSWTVVASAVPNAGETTTFTDSAAARSDSARYYVVRENRDGE